MISAFWTTTSEDLPERTGHWDMETGRDKRLEEIVKAGIQAMKELEKRAGTEKAGAVYTR